MTNDSERAAAAAGQEDRTTESETKAIVWPTDLDGTSTIRMQVLTDVPGAAATVDTVFDVSDGSGYKTDPFVTPDAHSAGWGVAWLESPEPGSPAQVKLTYVDPLGETTGELTVHEEAGAGATIHQHDVVLSSFGSPDPRDPIKLLIDGINVVWISTELGPHDAPETASPYGRVMFQRYEVTLGKSGPSSNFRLEEVEHKFSSTANDNQPVELGFGRSPSVTKSADGETAITWIDERDQIQGVFISDEIDNSRLSTRMRSLSPGIEQLRGGTSHVQDFGVAIGNMIALEFFRDTKFVSLVTQMLSSEKFVDKPGSDLDIPLPNTNRPDSVGLTHDIGASLANWDESTNVDGLTALAEIAWQQTSLSPAELSDKGQRSAVESSSPDAASANSDRPAPIGSAAAHFVVDANREDVSGQAADSAGGPNVGAQPQVVNIVSDGDGKTNVFGAAFDVSGLLIPGVTVQLSDGIGVVDHPIVGIGKSGYLAVWEEKTDDGTPSDLKGRYYSFGDADLNIAPGVVGAEFSIHVGTGDQNEHSAVVSAYAIENADHEMVEVGFQVAYVATESHSSDDDFGAINVARIVVDVDFADGQSPPLSPAHEQPAEVSIATSTSKDIQILTLATEGRDPAIAALSQGEQIVTWVKDDGRIDGAILAPCVSEDDGGGLAEFNVGALNLSEVMADEVVARHQGQQVLALQERSFVLVWVADDADGGFDIVGKHFKSTDDGQWIPSDTDIYIRDIRTSHDNERIDFKIRIDDGDDGFTIAYRLEGDDGADYQISHFDKYDDNSGPGDGDSAAPTLVVVLDTSDAATFDVLALKPEYAQPARADDDGWADEYKSDNSGSGSDGDNSYNSDSGNHDLVPAGPNGTQANSGLPDPHNIEDRSHDIWHT